jgi:hypothetical protein
MPDFKRTEKIFQELGPDVQKFYKKPMEQIDDEQFNAKTTNPDTGAPYKISDLPVQYRNFLDSDSNPNKGKTYPIRQVYQIIRIKRMNGTEWLKSRGPIIGLDKLGNEIQHSFTDPEVFFRPKVRYELRHKDPKNESSPMERTCVSSDLNPYDYVNTEYTLPWSLDNFEELYKQRPTTDSSSVSLVIMVEGSSNGPRSIDSVDKFKGDFDELWQEAITPRYKLDRSYNDHLENSPIG